VSVCLFVGPTSKKIRVPFILSPQGLKSTLEPRSFWAPMPNGTGNGSCFLPAEKKKHKRGAIHPSALVSAAPGMAAPSHVLPFLSPAGGCAASSARAHSGYRAGLLRCSAAAGQAGFFTRLGRLIKEKAKSDVEKLFSGFSKTRENLSVVDELLTYWNLADTDRVLDDLEEVLLPTTASVLPLTLSAACPICSVLMMLLADAHPVTQALLVSDFGPKISFRIVDTLREEIRDGKLKSGAEIKVNSIGLGCWFQLH
jgi:hypothetical protein